MFGDKMLSAMRGIVNPTIQAVLRFDRGLDAERLERTFALTLDAEPVLGCRFVVRFMRPYWTPSAGEARRAAFDACQAGEVEAQYQDFFALPLDIARGPALRLRLLQGASDVLCVTIDHLAGDAGGFKETLYLLASVYRELGRDPRFVPPINGAGSRGLEQVMGRFDRAQRSEIARQGAETQRRYRLLEGHHPLVYRGSQPHVHARRVEGGRFAALRSFARAQASTLNDVVVAAWYTALHQAIKPPGGGPLKLLSTADLRRYLPGERGEAVTNLSGFVYLVPDAPPAETLALTTAAMRDLMNAQKSQYLGLGDFVFMPAVCRALPSGWFMGLVRAALRANARSGRMLTGLTNMGPIRDDLLDFGGPRVTEAWLIPPMVFPPMVTMGVSGYVDSLSFAISYLRTPGGPDPVAEVLDRMVTLLP